MHPVVNSAQRSACIERPMMAINNLKVGDIYRLERGGGKFALLQVSAGGDCAVFLGRDEEDATTTVNAHKPEFRVIVVQQSLKKNCKRVGKSNLQPGLASFQKYAELDWSGKKKLVSLDNVDYQFDTSDDEWLAHERFAFWNIIHIERRLDGEDVDI